MKALKQRLNRRVHRTMGNSVYSIIIQAESAVGMIRNLKIVINRLKLTLETQLFQ